MAHGHMIPTLDMAKLFGTRSVKVSIITTPANVPLFSNAIRRSRALGIDVDLKLIEFPYAEAGLPEGFEHTDFTVAKGVEMINKLFVAGVKLKEPVEELLREFKPDCLVADMFFPWATDSAAKFGIPRLVFHGTAFFSLCSSVVMSKYEPYKMVLSDSEPFLLPGIPPGDIFMTRNQLAGFMKSDEETSFSKLVRDIREAEEKSYGVVVNSFYELEPVYADYYRNVIGRRAWHVGPLFLWSRDLEDKTTRGKQASIDENECMKWLDRKKPNSVVYICFGSMVNFSCDQLMEIATGLEASGQDFIWVVSKHEKDKKVGCQKDLRREWKEKD